MTDAYDYSGLQNMADRLIQRFGRNAQIALFQTTADPDAPWTPGGQTELDTDVKAVFTKMTETYVDGELVQVGDQWVLVGAKVLLDVNLKGIVKDSNGEVWKIVRIKKIKPGPMNMLYKIQVRQ